MSMALKDREDTYKKQLSEKVKDEEKIYNYLEFLSIVPSEYREFVTTKKDYQKELAMIKNLCLE
jgi:hypothetical protein